MQTPSSPELVDLEDEKEVKGGDVGAADTACTLGACLVRECGRWYGDRVPAVTIALLPLRWERSRGVVQSTGCSRSATCLSPLFFELRFQRAEGYGSSILYAAAEFTLNANPTSPRLESAP